MTLPSAVSFVLGEPPTPLHGPGGSCWWKPLSLRKMNTFAGRCPDKSRKVRGQNVFLFVFVCTVNVVYNIQR